MERKAYGTYEVADICHVTPATIGNWIEKGILPTFSTGGGHRRVWEDDLEHFLKEHNIPVPGELVAIQRPAILIVDDEVQVRRVVKRALRQIYPEAVIFDAEDGFEAGQKVAQILPSLIILDIMLPGLDGYKVCKAIRANERMRHSKILAISGHNIEETRKNILAAGADDFLGKPFTVDALKEKAIRLLKADKMTEARKP